MQRKNMNFEGCPLDCDECGVDLNRNFGYKYGVSGVSRDPCSEQYLGTGPFSEPESQALAEVLRQNAKNMIAYISLHSYGPTILYPWGYAPKPVNDWKDLKKAGIAAAKAIKKLNSNSRFQVQSSGRDLYPAAGGSDDYARSLGVKYSYTIELQPGGPNSFDPSAAEMRRYARANYHGLVAMAIYIKNSRGTLEKRSSHIFGSNSNNKNSCLPLNFRYQILCRYFIIHLVLFY